MKTVITERGFIDQNCTIEHNGIKFESGGAFLAKRIDTGKFGGVVYAPSGNILDHVSNWDGSIKMPAQFGREWISNFGDKRRSVWFRYSGKRFYGVWCSTDWSQLVRVKEIN